MKNKEYIEYTYKHRKIVTFLAEKYFPNNVELLEQLKAHDMDKLFTYLFYAKKDVHSVHRSLMPHHENELEKTYLDYVEMVLDWESARYTKPDKPLNAYDTLYKYYPEMEDNILPILKEIGIDKPSLPDEIDVKEYALSISNVSIEEIKKEMKDYIDLMFN